MLFYIHLSIVCLGHWDMSSLTPETFLFHSYVPLPSTVLGTEWAASGLQIVVGF